MINPGPEETLSTEQRIAIAEWIEHLQPIMRLQDWDIKISATPPENRRDAWGTTKMRASYKEATMSFSAYVLDEPEREVAKTIVHEMTHLIHGDYRDAMVEAVASAEDHVKAAVLNAMERYTELMVESFARVLVDSFELPSLKKVMGAPGVNDVLP